MTKVIIICAVLVSLLVSVNAFSGTDIVKERFQENDIQLLKEKIDRLERRVSHLEKVLGQGSGEKKSSGNPKKQMEKEMNDRLNIPK